MRKTIALMTLGAMTMTGIGCETQEAPAIKKSEEVRRSIVKEYLEEKLDLRAAVKEYKSQLPKMIEEEMRKSIREELLKEFEEERIESKENLEEAIRREKIVEKVEIELNTKIEYDRLKHTSIKKGSRVLLKKDSKYACQNKGIGTVVDAFGTEQLEGEPAANVKWDDGKSYFYRKVDLKPAIKLTAQDIIKDEYNRKILEKVVGQTVAEFRDYLVNQTAKAIEQSETSPSKNFEKDDVIVMNKNASSAYKFSRQGSIGIIEGKRPDGKYDVKFRRLTGPNSPNIPMTYDIKAKYMEHISAKSIAEIQGGPLQCAQKVVDKAIIQIEGRK